MSFADDTAVEMYIPKKSIKLLSLLQRTLPFEHMLLVCIYAPHARAENRRGNEVRMVPEEQDVRWDHCCWHQSKRGP